MPREVTAFGVKIVSPGDARMELVIAREVIGEWNALYALGQGRILLPLQQDAAAGCPIDLLIAFFCTSHGAPDESASSAVEREIEKQLAAQRPAIVYFSDGRTDLDDRNSDHSRAWEKFKTRFKSQAVLDSFGDEKEFRAKFAQQLEETVGTHAWFKGEASAQPTAGPVALPAVQPDDHSLVTLSTSAQSLLSEACDDPEAYIGRSRDNSGLKLQANGRQFVPQGDPVATAMWEKAFDELLTRELIRDAGCKGRLFQISTKGFEYLKSIGKSPVGYIAELGGM